MVAICSYETSVCLRATEHYNPKKTLFFNKICKIVWKYIDYRAQYALLCSWRLTFTPQNRPVDLQLNRRVGYWVTRLHFHQWFLWAVVSVPLVKIFTAFTKAYSEPAQSGTHLQTNACISPCVYITKVVFQISQPNFSLHILMETRGSVVDWGTILQAGRSWVWEGHWIFNRPNPSSRTMALGSTQPLRLTNSPPSVSRLCRKIWEPRRLTILRASTACYTDSLFRLRYVFFYFPPASRWYHKAWSNLYHKRRRRIKNLKFIALKFSQVPY
jgi:hypothetical protein